MQNSVHTFGKLKKVQEDSNRFKKIQTGGGYKVLKGSRRFKKVQEGPRRLKKSQEYSRRLKNKEEGLRMIKCSTRVKKVLYNKRRFK